MKRTTTPRALVLTRVSSSGQLESSPAQQMAACKAFADAKGWEVVELPRAFPRNISGTSRWEKRIDLIEAVRLYKAGEVDRLVCYAQDRLERNYVVFRTFVEQVFNVRHQYDIWNARDGQPVKKTLATGVQSLVAEEHAHHLRA